MVLQLEPNSIASNSGEIFVREFGLVEAKNFDLTQKRYAGKIYRLTPESAKVIVEALGFAVKVDSPSVRMAVVDIHKSVALAAVESARNTKPSEVGLRYAADRWSILEKGNTSKPWFKNVFQSKALSHAVLAAVASELKFRFEDGDAFFIRLNLKENTFGLIAEVKDVEKFPTGSFEGFELPAKETKVQTTEIGTNTSSDTSTAKMAPSGNAKYATYSRSEVDQLLKQQLEQVNSMIAQKLGGQKKELQDFLNSLEKNSGKLSTNLEVYADGIKRGLDEQRAKTDATIKENALQAKNAVSQEIEQFKQYVSKNVMPNMKTLDERIASALDKKSDITSAQPVKSNPAGMVLALVALAISLADLYLFMHK